MKADAGEIGENNIPAPSSSQGCVGVFKSLNAGIFKLLVGEFEQIWWGLQVSWGI